MIYVIQAVLFALPPLINAYFPVTNNGLLPVAWGVVLAYGATVEVPKWLAALRRRRNTRFEAEKRVSHSSDSAFLD